MGYIKKLKNNELVGGTDKTTIYPVTSTKAVFEEVTDGDKSSFKSQETINKEQQDELDDHEERIQAAEVEDIKSITINGSTKKFRVDDNNNVDLTIYTVDNDPEMPSIASNVEDLRNMVGTSTPVQETSHKTRIETLEGGESVAGSVENKIKTKVDSINSSYQDDDNEYVKYSMTQISGKVTDFNIDETSLKNAITSLNTSISGDNIVIRSGSTPSGTGEAGKIYRYVNSSNNTYTDYMYSGGSWVALATHDTSNEQAQVAYYTCIAAGSGAQATKQFVSNGSLEYTPSSGGHIKILMGEANAATGTIYLQFGTTTSTKKPLYYNGEPASESNTWEAGETIAVYYDPSANNNAGAYFASNAQGGGGKAEKIKYDNSQSGLASENVQGALDKVSDELYNATSLDVSYGGDYTWILGTINPDNGRAYSSSSYHHINIPVEAGMRMKITANQNIYTQYTFLKDINFSYAGSNGTAISSHYCDGYSNVIRVEAGESAALTIPEDCNYLYIACGQTSDDVRAPESVVVLHPKLDIAQETGQSTEKVMSQKAVTEELEVHGDNLIDMSVLSANSTSTSYITTTKDVENNGVQFYVVAHQTKNYAHGSIYPVSLVAGKTYKLSFEYLNTAGESVIATRDSSSGYIPCASLESKHVTPNAEYAEYENNFIAPEGAVYYLAFMYLTQGSANSSLTIRNFSLIEVNELKNVISEIDDEIKQLQEGVENIDNIKADAIDVPVVSDGKAVKASDGTLVTITDCCHSDFLPTYEASKISVYAPPLGSSNFGIAFYGRSSTASFITPADPSIYLFSHRGGWKWITYDVPEGATKFRMSLWYDTPSQYRLVTPLNYLQDIFLRGVEDMIATQIFRNAKMVSEIKYKYAFPVQQVVIIDGKAYITYFGSETKYDDDVLGRPNSVLCRAVVNLGDMSHTTEYPTVGTTQYADGTTANPVKIGYVTECPTPNNSIAKFGLMRFNNKNPYYCWAIETADVIANNWKTCMLSYIAGGTTHNVDFTVNNYRQMLVDMGYTPTYIASTANAVDNINIHYDKTEGIYYAVLCHNNSAFPLIMMQSTDLATWSPKANLGASYSANEIEAIYKNGIAYVAWRTASSQMRWRIYDVANSTLLGEGVFPGTKEILSKPDVFTFNGNVYMAVNINPSVYGYASGAKVYTTDARSQIAIYKVIGNTIKLFRQVCNPTGINYFSFMEINENYPAEVSQAPINGQGSIYIAFSEDRRHFYRRQLAQISFADVTALFADFNRLI